MCWLYNMCWLCNIKENPMHVLEQPQSPAPNLEENGRQNANPAALQLPKLLQQAAQKTNTLAIFPC